ncbi:endonuclease [bacterium]|nr:endonuclease [bacterium]
MKATKLIFLAFFTFSQLLFAAIPAGYYDTATGTGATLKTNLHYIIDGHSSQSYDSLYVAYQTTDNTGANTVWDMYSAVPGGTPAYTYTHGSNQCGSYNSEADCYNREHSIPSSWFGSSSPMYTDLFMVYPTDGYVNGRRSNYPFGETSSPTWTSTNGSKVGSCSYAGYSGPIFEPIDEYKGDFARTYFYTVTRYEDRITSWDTTDTSFNGTSYPGFQAWAYDMFLEWHNADPVSQKEINRNDAVYAIQGNRNPYIDHPEWVCDVWGGTCVGCDDSDTTPPDWAVSGVSNIETSSLLADQVTLMWDAASEIENDTFAISYYLYRSGTSPVDTATATLVASGTTSTSATDNTVSAETTYYYKVVASNCVPVTRTASDEIEITTPAETTDTIFSVQNTAVSAGTCYDSPRLAQEVTLTGIVTAIGTGKYVIADADGAWNGVYIYDSNYSPSVGDNITITGIVEEYFGLTEITTITSYTLNSSGNSVTPATVTCEGIGGSAEWGAACNIDSEEYEGVLVTLYDVVVSSPLSTYGYWMIKDQSGTLELSCDDSFYLADLATGQTISQITGVLLYTYDHYRLNPRSASDVDTSPSVNACDNGDTTPPDWSVSSVSNIDSTLITSSSAALTWDSATDAENDTEAITYDLYRSETSPVDTATAILMTTGITSTSYTDSSLSGGTTYYYKVVASNCVPLFMTASDEVEINTPESVLPKWTVAVFLNCDNNLETDGIDDFLEMSAVGSDANLNIVVQMDRIGGYDSSYDNWTTTKRYYVTSGMTPTIANAVSDIGEANMGDGDTLVSFGKWVRDNYPAEHYMLVIWDHGDGWRKVEDNLASYKGASSDDTSGDYLYFTSGTPGMLGELGTAFKEIYTYYGSKLDIVGYDVCLDQMWENNAESAPYFDYMVASEMSEWLDGWSYTPFLNDIVNSGGMITPEALANSVVDAYAAGESGSNGWTQSALDLAQVSSGLTPAINSFAIKLRQSLSSYGTQIQNARANTFELDSSYPYYDQIDLYDFCLKLEAQAVPQSLKDSSAAVRTAITNAVTNNFAETGNDCYGTGIYYPLSVSDYDADYDSTQIATTSNWDEFIQRETLAACDDSDTTPPDWTVSGVSDIAVTNTASSSITLSWGVAADTENTTEAVTYDLYRSGSTPVDTSTATVVASNLTGTTYADSTVVPENTYYYKIAAKNCVPLEKEASDEVKTTTPAGPAGDTIYSVQFTGTVGAECYDSPRDAEEVTLTGVVTATATGKYVLSDADGEWNGLYVYDFNYTPAVGDNITITGTVDEYFGLTELTTITSYTLNSSGNPVNATTTTVEEIGDNDLEGADCDLVPEAYEGVLVTFYDVVVSSTTGNHGYWEFRDSAGTKILGCDDAFYHAEMTAGQTISQLTGVLLYGYDYYRLNPRSAADIDTSGASLCDDSDTTAPDWTVSGISNLDSTSVSQTSVALSWDAASDSDNNTQALTYDLYRSNSTPLNTTTATLLANNTVLTIYADNTVSASNTYYYLVTVSNCVPLSRDSSDELTVVTPAVPVDTIYSIQFTGSVGLECYDSPREAEEVTLTGDVTAVGTNKYIITDADGAWSGIYVYDFTNFPAVGDNITITGTVDEYFGLSQINTITVYVVNSSGNSVNATTTTVEEIGDNDPEGANCDLVPEAYEGVLVTFYDVVVSSTTGNHGYWEFKDSAGTKILGCDDQFYHAEMTAGQTISQLTGVLLYGYDYYRLNPRSAADINTAPIPVICDPADVTAADWTVSGISNICSTAIAHTSIDLEWDAASDLENDTLPLTYDLYRDTVTISDTSSLTPIVEDTEANTYLDTGLTMETTYYYKVVVRNCVPLEREASDELALATLPACDPADTTAPDWAVSGISNIDSTLVTYNAITIVWDAATDAQQSIEEVLYDLFRSGTTPVDTISATLLASDTNALTFADSGLTPATEYFYLVVAKNCIPLSRDASDELDVITRSLPHTISGTITDGAVPMAGVTVDLSGYSSASTVTDGSGNYSFVDVPHGESYTVAPSFTHYSFSPSFTDIASLDSDQTSVDFTGTLNTWDISGTITDGTNPISGVTVDLSGSATATTTTDGSGNYSFAGLDAGGDYTVTPSLTHYTFAPASTTHTDLSADETATDFTGTLNTWDVSGTITDGTDPLSGVTVDLSGYVSASTTTDGSGNYSFAGLDAGATYMVTPSYTHYMFVPSGTTHFALNGDRNNTDFTGTINTWDISGTITDGTNPISGVTVDLSGSAAATTVTDGSGNYSFADLDAGGDYTITPSHTHYIFAPVNISILDLSANDTGNDFTGTLNTWEISGTITNGATPLSGVTVDLTGSATTFAVTDGSGNYSFAGLDAGGDYTVTPSLTHYSFAPTSTEHTDLSADETSTDFTATLNTWTISGTITDGANQISGVTVDLSGYASATTTTDGSGNYSFAGLNAGEDFTITPSMTHYTFAAPSNSYNNISSDISSSDFTGTLNTWDISGTITDGANAISGATVDLSGYATASTTTDGSGNYSFAGLDAGKDYTITPSHTHYVFSPANTNCTVLSANVPDVDFTGTLNSWSISGSIMSGTTPLADIKVVLTGASITEVYTDISGYYLFTDLDAGATYTITPEVGLYKYTPESAQFIDLTLSQVQDFDAVNNYAQGLGDVVVYPVPWSSNMGIEHITFANLSENSSIAIYSISGEFVIEMQPELIDHTWDLRTRRGKKVVSGVYIYIITDEAGEQIQGKCVILK